MTREGEKQKDKNIENLKHFNQYVINEVTFSKCPRKDFIIIILYMYFQYSAGPVVNESCNNNLLKQR